MVQHLDSGCVFAIFIGSQHLWCQGSQPKHVSNPDSVLRKSKPHLMHACFLGRFLYDACGLPAGVFIVEYMQCWWELPATARASKPHSTAGATLYQHGFEMFFAHPAPCVPWAGCKTCLGSRIRGRGRPMCILYLVDVQARQPNGQRVVNSVAVVFKI